MKLGAQLFTLREYTQNEKDLAFSLQKVAEMGYTQVQISAVGPIAPEVIASLCRGNGLEIVLTNTNVERIRTETEAVIQEHEKMQCPYIGIGYMPDRYHHPEWLEHFVWDFQEAAKKIRQAGMLLMYHNHDFEFRKVGGKRILEYLAESFSPEEMGFTLDTYWVQAAGGDVCQWIEYLKGRIPCVHLKDMDMGETGQIMAPVLEGNMNFPTILDALQKAGAQHLLVEQDVCRESPFVCLKKSYDNLAALGYR